MRHQSRLAFKAFDPIDIGPGPANNFFKIMQERHIAEILPNPGISSFAFVPLQARLETKRKWQYADAITMVNTIRTHDPSRLIVIKLHPKVTYSQSEMALISTLLKDPLIRLETTATQSLLAHCAYVATQNSAAAFEGILHRKPAILFASSDFHHIFETVTSPANAATAFAGVLSNDPPFEKYLFWFLRLNCANVTRKTAEAKIVEMVNEAGWDLPL